MTILIIIDGTVYRAKEKWPITMTEIKGSENATWRCLNINHALKCISNDTDCEGGINRLRRPVLAACFDEVGPDTSDYNEYEEPIGAGTFSLDRLTGKE